MDSVDQSSFLSTMVATFSMIVVSEIGDRTFFIVAIMAMQNSRALVFAGAMSSLSIMHAISTLFGYSAKVVPRRWTQLGAAVLFAVFAYQQLKKAGRKPVTLPPTVLETRRKDLEANSAIRRWKWLTRLPPLSPVFVEAFVVNFLAEWGDRSQIATVAFGAKSEVTAVLIGGLLAHGLCNAMAAIGGSFVAKVLSPRLMTYISGSLFLFFALSTLYYNL